MASVDDLATVPLFNSVDKEQLAKLANWFHVQNANEGVRLVGEGPPGYTFFVLVEGTAAVTSEDQTLTELTAGDFFGEVAILGDGRRTATVTSTTPVRLSFCSEPSFDSSKRHIPRSRLESRRRCRRVPDKSQTSPEEARSVRILAACPRRN